MTMHMETTGKNLKSALKMISDCVPGNFGLPVLRCVKIEGGEITATDIDNVAKISLPTNNKPEGAALVDYGCLSAIANNLPPNEVVNVSELDESVRITFNGGEYCVPSMPVGEFPEIGEFSNDAPTTNLHNGNFLECLGKVGFAVSFEEVRYYINGVSIGHTKDGKPCVVATDGHRMAVHPLQFDIAGAEGKIIPNNLLKILHRHGPANGLKQVRFDNQKQLAEFQFFGSTVRGKLIDGTYPDFNRVIPANTVKAVTFDRMKLLAATKRISGALVGLGHNYFNALTLSTHEKTGEIKIHLKTLDGETMSETVACEVHTSEPIELGISRHYLLDMLKAFKGCEMVTLNTVPKKYGSAPCKFTSDETDLFVIQMPMWSGE